jgi:hypothetical protein
MTEIEKIQQALDNFLENDKNALNQMVGFMGWGHVSESHRLNFVEGRLQDACAMILILSRYILDRDKK